MTIQSQKAYDEVLIIPASRTEGVTVTANFDTRNGDYATIRVNFGTEETTHAVASTVSLLESDDTVVSNFATITADVTHDLVTGHEARYEVDLRGRKRYLRLSVTTGTVTGGDLVFGAIGTLTRQDEAPGNTTDMISPTHGSVTIV